MKAQRKKFFSCFLILLILSACSVTPEQTVPTFTEVPASSTPEAQESPIPPTPSSEPTPMGGGGKIIFLSERYAPGIQEVFIADADNIGNWTNLTLSGDRKSQLTVSPNGKLAAYKSGIFPEAEFIVVINLEDPAPQPFVVSPTGARVNNPVWSPDSTRLALEFTPNGSRVPQIIVVTPGGADYVVISDTTSLNVEPAWSGDGQGIFYISSPSEGGSFYGMPQLILAAVDGSGRNIVFAPDNIIVKKPITNPNLDGFAFFGASFVMGEYGNAYLSLAGGQPVPMVSAARDLQQTYFDEYWYAAFSPESAKLAFAYVDAFTSVDPIKQGILFVMNSQGSGLRRVADLGEGFFTAPSWSPDGTRFVYSNGGSNSRILIYDTITNKNIPFTDDSFSNSSSPQWIKDTSRVDSQSLSDERVEISMPDIPFKGLMGRLAFVKNDEELQMLDFNENKAYLISDMPGRKKQLTWSPNHQTLAFVNTFAEKASIYLVEPDKATRLSNTPLNVTEGFTSAHQPSFSPDGKWLAFSAGNADGTYHIYILELATGNIQALTSGSVVDEAPRWNSKSDVISFSRQDFQIFSNAPYLGPKELFYLSLADGVMQPLASADVENKDAAIWYEKQNSYLYMTKYNGQMIVQMMMDPMTNNSTTVSLEIGPADIPTWNPSISPKGDFIAAQACNYVEASNYCMGYLYIGHPLFEPFFFSEPIGEFNSPIMERVGVPAWSPDGAFVIAAHAEEKLSIVNMASKKINDFLKGNLHSPAWAP